MDVAHDVSSADRHEQALGRELADPCLGRPRETGQIGRGQVATRRRAGARCRFVHDADFALWGHEASAWSEGPPGLDGPLPVGRVVELDSSWRPRSRGWRSSPPGRPPRRRKLASVVSRARPMTSPDRWLSASRPRSAANCSMKAWADMGAPSAVPVRVAATVNPASGTASPPLVGRVPLGAGARDFSGSNPRA